MCIRDRNEENKEIPCSCTLYASYADTVGCCSRNSDSTGSRAAAVSYTHLFVEEDAIEAEVAVRYWPLNKIGTVK